MTKTFEEITNEEVFDIRDVIERFEELETELNDIESREETAAELAEWHNDYDDEYFAIQKFLDETKGNGGDEQWRGDWYPVTFIQEGKAFEDYMDQMLEDCGDMQAYDKIPAYLTITVDYDMLKQDYTSIELPNGNGDYLYR